MLKQKRLFFRDRFRNVFFKNRRNDFPKTVTRMPVKKHLLSGFNGREGTEDEQPAIRIKNRVEWMIYWRLFHLFCLSYRGGLSDGTAAELSRKKYFYTAIPGK